jgi:hypothetical protein
MDPTRVDESALGDPENPEQTEEDATEESENGHLEIQAAADSTCHLARGRWPLPKHRSHHHPRSDRRLAFPGAQAPAFVEGHDFSRAVGSLKTSALAAGGFVCTNLER